MNPKDPPCPCIYLYHSISICHTLSHDHEKGKNGRKRTKWSSNKSLYVSDMCLQKKWMIHSHVGILDGIPSIRPSCCHPAWARSQPHVYQYELLEKMAVVAIKTWKMYGYGISPRTSRYRLRCTLQKTNLDIKIPQVRKEIGKSYRFHELFQTFSMATSEISGPGIPVIEETHQVEATLCTSEPGIDDDPGLQRSTQTHCVVAMFVRICIYGVYIYIYIY